MVPTMQINFNSYEIKPHICVIINNAHATSYVQSTILYHVYVACSFCTTKLCAITTVTRHAMKGEINRNS